MWVGVRCVGRSEVWVGVGCGKEWEVWYYNLGVVHDGNLNVPF